MNKYSALLALLSVLFFSNCGNDTTTYNDESDTDSTSILATDVTVNSLTETTDYISSGFTFLSPEQIDLNLQAVGGDDYTEVYGFNVPSANRASGFVWYGDDETSAEWRPQGIAGYTNGSEKYLLVSWYAQTSSYQGARITLIDINPDSNTYLQYRHILLVQNTISSSTSYTQLTTFAPLDIHAGGMACYKNQLYVASTDLGIRVFDLDKIIEVISSNADTKCGVDSNGDAYAFGYKYILPQTGYYKIEGASPYSTIQLNYEENELWTAQYYAKSNTTITPKAFGFPMDSSGTLSESGQKEIAPRNSLFTNYNAYGMQGIFRKGDSTWLSCTGAPESFNSTARLIRYKDGDVNSEQYVWPYGAESLYYDADTDYLWCLTEYEVNGGNNEEHNNRCVFAVKFEQYQ